MMRTIRVTQLVDELSDPEDRIELPAGTEGKGSVAYYSGFRSLDAFHASVPIGCLEDFEIVPVDNNDDPITDCGGYVVVMPDHVSGPYDLQTARELVDVAQCGSIISFSELLEREFDE
jgi:hypothetical protein